MILAVEMVVKLYGSQETQKRPEPALEQFLAIRRIHRVLAHLRV